MATDTVAIRPGVVNRARLLRGLGRLEFYKVAKCDPRTGCKALGGGRVHISVVRRLANAVGLSVADVIDLEESGLSDAPRAGDGAGEPAQRQAV